MTRRETVSGDAAGGYVVDLHDGDRHESYSIHADTMDAALAEAAQRWDAEAEEPEAPAPVQVIPEAARPVDAPGASDPLSVDVTRGRPGDEVSADGSPTQDPDAADHPSLPT